MSLTEWTWKEGGMLTVKTTIEGEIRLQLSLSAVSAPLTNGQPLLAPFDGLGIFRQVRRRIGQVRRRAD